MVLRTKDEKSDLYFNPHLYGNEIEKEDAFKLYPEKGYVLVGKDILHQRYMEDEKGLKQGMEQNFGFGLTDKELLPNQEKIGEYAGQTLFRYLEYVPTYKDGEQQGPSMGYREDGTVRFMSSGTEKKGIECSFDKDERLEAVTNYKNGVHEYVQVNYDTEGRASVRTKRPKTSVKSILKMGMNKGLEKSSNER